MDPITLATVTAAVTVLASEVAKGAASEAGKTLWSKVKSVLGWHAEPKAAELAPTLAQQLQGDAALARQIVQLLQTAPARTETFASALVQNVDAEKVIIAGTITGNITM